MEKTENSTPYSPRYGEAETGGTGRLKIFFGYAAGVGKTYAMLEAAHQAQKEGVDVVIGSEMADESINCCSMVKATYHVNGQPVGSIHAGRWTTGGSGCGSLTWTEPWRADHS